MTYDVFSYNGEKELLDLRLNILSPYVDKFVIIEFDETFSGKSKEKLFLKDYTPDWDKFKDKIDYAFIRKQDYQRYDTLAESSPNVPKNGPAHWKQEFCQKESIKDILFDLEDDDLVYIGDVDEIWNPTMPLEAPRKLKLRVYSYYLDNLSTEQFWGTIVAQYRDIKDRCLNHLRTNELQRTQEDAGWHFTSVGGPARLRRKLTDSYTAESYAHENILQNIEENLKRNQDFLGRQFTYTNDDSYWPQYLKDNRARYGHLLKP